jgi:hypothetical protein
MCGWRRPRPPGLRLAAGSLVVSDCFLSRPQVTCAQPRGLHRCTSARGTRRCRAPRMAVLCAHLCSAGTRRCRALTECRHAQTMVQRRARTQSDKCVNRGPHGACGPAHRLAWSQSPDERLPREKGRLAPFLLAGVQGQRPAGGAGAAPRSLPSAPTPTPPRSSLTACSRACRASPPARPRADRRSRPPGRSGPSTKDPPPPSQRRSACRPPGSPAPSVLHTPCR